jgi:hypothetical protein
MTDLMETITKSKGIPLMETIPTSRAGQLIISAIAVFWRKLPGKSWKTKTATYGLQASKV